jgi:hypothetical protein
MTFVSCWHLHSTIYTFNISVLCTFFGTIITKNRFRYSNVSSTGHLYGQGEAE